MLYIGKQSLPRLNNISLETAIAFKTRRFLCFHWGSKIPELQLRNHCWPFKCWNQLYNWKTAKIPKTYDDVVKVVLWRRSLWTPPKCKDKVHNMGNYETPCHSDRILNRRIRVYKYSLRVELLVALIFRRLHYYNNFPLIQLILNIRIEHKA